MSASYDCGIETNVQAWHAVHDGLRDGLALLEISGRAGISYGMVHAYRRMPAPSSVVRRINRNHAGPLLCDCGAARSIGRGGHVRCDSCERKRVRAATDTPGRVELLRSWALRNGRCPDINEVRDLTGLSRSRAGDVMIDAFGKDPRNGALRRYSWRGWPEGAPDVPNPAGIERLREQGRHMAASPASVAGRFA